MITVKIRTRKLPATDTQGARVRASGEGHTHTITWDYSLDGEDVHLKAARELAESLPAWQPGMTVTVTGEAPRGYEYVAE